jgi:hypothetical protein
MPIDSGVKVMHFWKLSLSGDVGILGKGDQAVKVIYTSTLDFTAHLDSRSMSHVLPL